MNYSSGLDKLSNFFKNPLTLYMSVSVKATQPLKEPPGRTTQSIRLTTLRHNPVFIFTVKTSPQTVFETNPGFWLICVDF